jgi:tubulin-tyrosine ligase family protein
VRPDAEFIAAALSRPRLADIVVCRWHQVALDGGGVAVRGDMWRYVDGRRRDAHVRTALPVDALIVRSVANVPFPASPAERRALDALVALGVGRDARDRRAVVRALLHAASRRGVATTAGEMDWRWGAKHLLERMLRADQRRGGRCVRRPETHLATEAVVPVALSRFARRGLGCIVKPSLTDQGRGLQVIRPEAAGAWAPLTASRWYAVQALVENPLLLDGHKADIRCHVIVDPDDRSGSRLVDPVLIRRAGVPYVPALGETEIANLEYQHREGHPAEIRPIREWEGLSRRTRTEVLDSLTEMVDALLDAHRRWRDRVVTPARRVRRRLVLWGIDAVAAQTDAGVKVYLIEINDRAQLVRASDTTNRAMAGMLERDFLPALLSRSRRGLSSSGR